MAIFAPFLKFWISQFTLFLPRPVDFYFRPPPPCPSGKFAAPHIPEVNQEIDFTNISQVLAFIWYH